MNSISLDVTCVKAYAIYMMTRLTLRHLLNPLEKLKTKDWKFIDFGFLFLQTLAANLIPKQKYSEHRSSLISYHIAT